MSGKAGCTGVYAVAVACTRVCGLQLLTAARAVDVPTWVCRSTQHSALQPVVLAGSTGVVVVVAVAVTVGGLVVRVVCLMDYSCVRNPLGLAS